MRASTTAMSKRPRHAWESDSADDAVMERVKRLAIGSRISSPVTNASIYSEPPLEDVDNLHGKQDTISMYREQARMLRSLHFERIRRVGQLAVSGDLEPH